MSLTVKQINELLAKTRNKKYRKKTQGQIDAESARIAGLKSKLTDKQWLSNRSKQRIINNPNLPNKIGQSISEFYKNNPMPEERKEKISDSMRGKTLEELIGAERASIGRKKRSEFHKGRKRPIEVGQKIAATRRANGSYENNGMTGKEHKDSTKSIMSQKAAVRQELKRNLGLGKSDTVPKELLEKEYKKRGWK